MAEDEKVPVKRITATPHGIRPRSTPNAEINAQERQKVLRDMGMGYPLAPNQAYADGGRVRDPLAAEVNRAVPPNAPSHVRAKDVGLRVRRPTGPQSLDNISQMNSRAIEADTRDKINELRITPWDATEGRGVKGYAKGGRVAKNISKYSKVIG